MRAIINGRCIIPNSAGHFCIKSDMAIIFDENILSVIPNDSVRKEIFEFVFDAQGQYVSPGFINIHIHGCAGFDTMDDDDNALAEMKKFLPSTGVTSFLPTTMTVPLKNIQKALTKIKKATLIKDGAKILGANVEGPYISKKFKGAQAEENIRHANFDDIADFVDVVKIITVAPEELDNFDFVDLCHRNGIIVSIGHSAANYDTAIEFINNHGVNHITHLFNAQSGLHHRNPGVAAAALDSDAIVELIADNIHVHPALQRMVYNVKGRSKIILITDSLRSCGLGDGVYDLGGQKVFVNGELATLEDGTIAASVATMNKVIANFRTNTKIDVATAVELVTKNPAEELKIYNKVGSIEIGKSADIIIFNDDIKIKAAFIDGNLFSIGS